MDEVRRKIGNGDDSICAEAEFVAASTERSRDGSIHYPTLEVMPCNPRFHRTAGFAVRTLRRNSVMRHVADESPYDYSSMEDAADTVLRSLKGRVLDRSLAQVVGGEFNVLYLLFSDQSFAVHGRVGGEVLQIAPLDELPTEGKLNDLTAVVKFPAFEQFAGRRIASARTIGSAWNGHGFEFSFDGMYDRTMIVQSIHTGAEPPDFSDCLRLGVGSYHFSWPAGGVA